MYNVTKSSSHYNTSEVLKHKIQHVKIFFLFIYLNINKLMH